jgi:hypothetical protein
MGRKRTAPASTTASAGAFLVQPKFNEVSQDDRFRTTMPAPAMNQSGSGCEEGAHQSMGGRIHQENGMAATIAIGVLKVEPAHHQDIDQHRTAARQT